MKKNYAYYNNPKINSFKDLMNDNEKVETEEAILEFNEAEQAYNLALAATSNVIQKTLLDYL